MGDVTIDALVITLGLDPTGLTKGQKEALEGFRKTKTEAESEGKQMEAAGKQASQFYAQIKKEALGLFAVVQGAGGLKEFVSQTVTGLASIGRTAKAANVSIRDLSTFQNIVKLNGGSADEAAASIKNLAAEMERFKVTGQSAMLPAFAKIGAGRDDSATDVIHKFEIWAQGKPAQLVNYEGQQLGLPDAEINEAMKTPAEQARDRQDASRNAATPEDVAKATDLQRAFLELQGTLNRFSRDILIDVIPPLNGLIQGLDGAATAFPTFTKFVIGAGVALSVLAGLKFTGGVLAAGLGLGGKAAAAGGGAAAAAGGEVAAAEGAAVAAPLPLKPLAIGGIGEAMLIGKADAAADAMPAHPSAGQFAAIGGYYGALLALGNPNAANEVVQRTIDAIRTHGGDAATAAQAAAATGQPSGVSPVDDGHTGGGAGYGGRGSHPGTPANDSGGAAGGGGGAPAPDNATVAQRKAMAYQFFRAHGYPDAAARGLVAGMTAEDNNLDPQRRNPLSSATGIGQWLTARQQDYRAFSGGKDIHQASFNDELRFIDYELTHKEAAAGQAIKGAGSPLDALEAVITKYYRPGSGTGVDMRNGQRALHQQVNIDKIVVQTDSRDPKEHGNKVGKAIGASLADQANRGLV